MQYLGRELALANKNTIEVTDGAGSKVFKSNTKWLLRLQNRWNI
jgi:hypothetical protein